MKSVALSRRLILGGLAASAVLARSAAVRAQTASAPRIVALGGAATEILYALGLGDQVVGVDVSSGFPPEARKKPNVGYYRAISAEGALALSPTLIIATDGAGPKEAMDVLAAASVKLVSLKEIKAAEDIPARILTVAEAAGAPERGAELAAAVSADLKSLSDDVAQIGKRRRTLLLLGPPRSGTLMAGGAGSSGAFALTLAGADNAAAALSGWKPLTDEAAYGIAPDAIVVLQTGSPVSPQEIAQRPALADSPAVKEGRVITADALGLVGFGPRAAHAAFDVAKKIYPEATFRDLPPRAWTGKSAAGR
ncbi:ABC transporter substrate-binding protein [Chelatococcus sambhunathii]|uniref:ABC transporter substrate-binding protein n=1 Tax=Chelatococcus sambhunathii TaxID=363953 RepID=A0ABU1DHG1_9HYPH|nr:ABC transporter substrate-binding protein [Chelatococcus sambhunathii]MDR4307524.1 ABC transporter substrate-binding protein [Chelatococcus sambhunathii]